MGNVVVGDSPWIVTGVLNVISSADERVGGSSPNLQNMEEFNSMIFNCKLADAGYGGSQFMWTNGTLWQRLDRVLINDTWSDAFEITKILHLLHGILITLLCLLSSDLLLRGNHLFVS